MTRCTITVLRSSRHGGAAVVDLDGLRSGYTVTTRRVRGVTESTLTYSGTLRLGPIGDWLADMVPHLIATGCGVTAYVPGRYLAASVPGTIDLLVDGPPVTVGLQWDVGGEERPYVADAPECLTIAQCDAIDAAVAQAWDAHGREAA